MFKGILSGITGLMVDPWVKVSAALLVVMALGFTVMWTTISVQGKMISYQAATIRFQANTITAMENVTVHEAHTATITHTVIQRIMESPNANTPIPDDLANFWYDGIMCLRGSACSSAQPTNVRPAGNARPAGIDSGTTPCFLDTPGRGFSELSVQTDPSWGYC